MINSKEQIIEYFKSGIKKTQDFKIGIEHEKFLFNNHDNKRIDYSKVKEMFSALLEFGWNPILEKENIIGIWTKDKNRNDAKISSLGFRVTRGIIYHGVSININCDLSNFYNIEPCGISQPCVTSMQELHGFLPMSTFDLVLKENIRYLLNI